MGKFIFGLGIGFGLGLLYAPALGEDTRRKVVEQVGDLSERLSDVTKRASEIVGTPNLEGRTA